MNFRSVAIALALAPAAVAREDGLRALGGPPGNGDDCDFAGNGFPKGKGIQPIFRFKMLGRDLARKEVWDFDPNGQNSIAVALEGQTKILLEDSGSSSDCSDCPDDFCIPDPNGTDGEATLCMIDPFPIYENPCIDGDEPSCDEKAVFRIFARIRGKGNMSITTCVDVDGSDWCDVGGVELNTRKATDISQKLLTLCYDGAGIGLFDEICVDKDDSTQILACNDPKAVETEEQYFWDVDNDGVRNAEFRFYDQGELDSLYFETGCTWDAITRRNAC